MGRNIMTHDDITMSFLLQRDGRYCDALEIMYNYIAVHESGNIIAMHGKMNTCFARGDILSSLSAGVSMHKLIVDACDYPYVSEYRQDVVMVARKALEIYNARHDSGQINEAIDILEDVAVVVAGNTLILRELLTCCLNIVPKRVDRAIEVAEQILKFDRDNFSVISALADCYREKGNLDIEVLQRLSLARLETAPTVVRLFAIYDIINILTLEHNVEHDRIAASLDSLDEVSIIATRIWSTNPVAPENDFYNPCLSFVALAETMSHRLLLETNIKHHEHIDVGFISSDSIIMSIADLQEEIGRFHQGVVFYVAADMKYVKRLAKNYINSIIKICDVPYKIIIHVIGDIASAIESMNHVGIINRDVIYAYDLTPNNSSGSIYTCYDHMAPRRDNIVYLQSRRYLSANYIIQILCNEWVLLITDIDLILQRGVADMVKKHCDVDMVFVTSPDSHKRYSKIRASRIVGNMVLCRNTCNTKTFFDFIRAYVTLGLQKAERAGRIPFFFDQTSLVFSFIYTKKSSNFIYSNFDVDDINVVPDAAEYYNNRYRFFHYSICSGFNDLTVPEQ